MNVIDLETIKNSREVWVESREKTIPEDQLYYIDVNDLHTLRKLKRTRKNSKEGSASLDYVSMGKAKKKFRRDRSDEYVDGQTKWDDLVDSMKDRGWFFCINQFCL